MMMKARGFGSRQRQVQFGKHRSQPDMRQHLRSLILQYGPEAQNLFVAGRGYERIDFDDASELIFADMELRIVSAVAAVFRQ